MVVEEAKGQGGLSKRQLFRDFLQLLDRGEAGRSTSDRCRQWNVFALFFKVDMDCRSSRTLQKVQRATANVHHRKQSWLLWGDIAIATVYYWMAKPLDMGCWSKSYETRSRLALKSTPWAGSGKRWWHQGVLWEVTIVIHGQRKSALGEEREARWGDRASHHPTETLPWHAEETRKYCFIIILTLEQKDEQFAKVIYWVWRPKISGQMFRSATKGRTLANCRIPDEDCGRAQTIKWRVIHV